MALTTVFGSVTVGGITYTPTATITLPATTGTAVVSPVANWTANGNGVMTIAVAPHTAGDQLVLVVGATGAGAVNALSAGVAGGGVAAGGWVRSTGYLNTVDRELVEVWKGVVTTPGASTITVTNTSMATEWNRYWCEEYTASGTGLTWQVAAVSPATATTSASPSGTGSAVTYPALTGAGLYLGAAVSEYGTLNAGTTTGFGYATVDSHLQVVTNAAASGASQPTSSSTDAGDRWCTAAVLITASSTAVPLSVTTNSLPGAFTTQPYTAQLAAAGGVSPYTWSLLSGTLPAGLTLSSAGVISGTPTTAGTSSFTVKATDAAAATATAALSIVVTASPAVLFTGSYPPNAHATYTAPVADPQLSLAAAGHLPYVDLNVWGPVSGETLTDTVYSVRNWALTANMVNSSGSVTCFPNTGIFPINLNWYNWANYTSGWDETMDATLSGHIASACYDMYYTSPTSPNGSLEVMLHFDFRNRGAGPWWATGLKFGGYTAPNGDVIPVTYWNLSYVKGSTAAFFNLVTDASGTVFRNMPVGAVDLKAMLNYLIQQGILAAQAPMTGWSIGYEICDTEGQNRHYQYNNCWVHGG